ncbi:Gp37 protein [Nicoletella semolina]|uniref:Gp37 protein n=1 Tax=Nicoletella semolina TaxID=271160 RepID=A0A4R2N8L3_9PAST|nr:Gp37 family protein [Nicoletella semolina]MDH2924544.1 hypothetical protein [Nicoletella semolina]TCP17327.1 Gp37 protein [Nicoletella semolina]
MASTQAILTAIEQHLKIHLPDWQIELFPNDPDSYYLSHPHGAVLISYLGSKFESPRPTQHIIQNRHIQVALTVLTRHLHDDEGALNLLDSLHLAVVGFRPPDCNPCWLVDEFNNGQQQETGIWQYQLIIQADTVQVEQCQAVSSTPKFVNLMARDVGSPLDKRLKMNAPKGDKE